MDTQTNGRAMAAFLAAGIGTFALGIAATFPPLWGVLE